MSPEPSLGQAVLLHRRPAGGALPPERGRKEGPPSSGQERTTGQWEESSLAALGTFPCLSRVAGPEQSLGGFLSVKLVVTVSLSSVLSSPGVTCCCAPGPPRAEPSLQQQKPEQQQDQARHAQADEILHGVVLGLGGCRRREG